MFQNYVQDIQIAISWSIPCQVLTRHQEKASVEVTKVKEESLEVAKGKCWKQIWLRTLSATGELFLCLLISKARQSQVTLSPIKTLMFKKNKQIFRLIIEILRNLDLAMCRSFCNGCLCCPRNCLLQQRWLIQLCPYQVNVLNRC